MTSFAVHVDDEDGNVRVAFGDFPPILAPKVGDSLYLQPETDGEEQSKPTLYIITTITGDGYVVLTPWDEYNEDDLQERAARDI